MLICDIDGCTFNNLHRADLIPDNIKHTPNWTAFSKACVYDLPVLPVINLVKHLARMHGNKIVFVTSRVETAKEETANQLFEHFGDQNISLYMRPINDNRSPVDFKRAMFSELINSVNEYSTVIDDHKDIIKMVAVNFPHVNRLLVESFDCTVLKKTRVVS